MTTRGVALGLVILATIAIAGTAVARPPQNVPATSAMYDVSAAEPVSTYTLPPDLYRKARNLGRISFVMRLTSAPYQWLAFVLLILWKIPVMYRECAEKLSRRNFLQVLIYAALFVLTLAILLLPIDLFEHHLSRSYGLSVQGWGSWGWDFAKSELISIAAATIGMWMLFGLIRRSPRHWWFYFWLISLPIGISLVFLQPLVVDPLFHKFVPLAEKDPGLATSLRDMAQHAGENIPTQQMFWMDAGAKTTELNAYVTGIGASKRIVVWDTTIAKMTTPEVVFVAGHEMGHYVLLHIPKQLAWEAVALFLYFYLGFHCADWTLRRFGERWRIRGADDLAALPVIVLPLIVLSFVASPIESAVSRYYEHQADQYGLEITHGLTPDSKQDAARAFQILGEVDLADPAPSRADVFLFYSHPTIADRIRFALSYDPWRNGESGEFVKQ